MIILEEVVEKLAKSMRQIERFFMKSWRVCPGEKSLAIRILVRKFVVIVKGRTMGGDNNKGKDMHSSYIFLSIVSYII